MQWWNDRGQRREYSQIANDRYIRSIVCDNHVQKLVCLVGSFSGRDPYNKHGVKLQILAEDVCCPAAASKIWRKVVDCRNVSTLEIR